MEVHKWLEDKLPPEIVKNHIIPYTYQIQSKQLMQDVRSFYEDWNLIDGCYSFDFNSLILLKDLIFYADFSRFENILKRLHRYRETKYTRLYIIAATLFYNKRNINTDRKTRMIVGLLTPKQRTEFINKYIIEDEITM
jgi:hypothetical protein